MNSFYQGLSSGLGIGACFTLLAAGFAFRQWQKATKLELERSSSEEWRPLREKLHEFEDLVRETYEREGRERFHLEKEISSLSRETQLLSNSLRGDSKAQGDWGEIIVEKILESSGLRAGFEFELQNSFVGDDGLKFRPDVVVRLPGDRVLVIDAKVSLTAWDRFCRAEEFEEREEALNDHVQSLRRHVQTLSAKRYHLIPGATSPEFVFLFTRVEPAWIEALKADPEILEDAARAGISIVSPTTLFATLKTVASLWARERQNMHALEIADEAGKLYDKFVQFADDLGDVERGLLLANQSFEVARRKLTEGPGNLAARAEKIRTLGAKSTKRLSDVLQIQQEFEERS